MKESINVTINIKRWDNKEIIFSHTCEGNTEKITVKEAVKQKVSLAYADLRHFDLSDVIVSDIDLSHADLTLANFYNSIMGFAKLDNTELGGAILAKTNLRFSDLTGANLSDADLSHSNLSNVNLLDAALFNTYLDGSIVDNIITNYPMNLPDGEFIAWKKVHTGVVNEYIIKLKILEDSKRSRGTSDRCRCDKALVLEIQNLDGSKSDLTEVHHIGFSLKSLPCIYKVGEIVEADRWDNNRFNECSHGIHFFLSRERAVSY